MQQSFFGAAAIMDDDVAAIRAFYESAGPDVFKYADAFVDEGFDKLPSLLVSLFGDQHEQEGESELPFRVGTSRVGPDVASYRGLFNVALVSCEAVIARRAA